MLIDWFTVGAQVINFMILVWLMRRFYKPVLEALGAREKKIAMELADAAAKEAEALRARDEFRQKNEQFDHQRAALLKDATEEASAERHRLLDEAQRTADASSGRRQEALRNEAHNLNRAISRRAQQEVFAIARKTLADLSTTTLEDRVVDVFVRRVREMGDAARATLADAIKKEPESVVVRSAFELPAEQRAAVTDALNRAFSVDIRVRFETAPDLVSGIELATSGHKVGWSIAEYLRSLEKAVAELLGTQQGKTDANVDTKAKPEPTLGANAGPIAEPELRPDAGSDATRETRTS